MYLLTALIRPEKW
ncbi:hypothetical protein LOH53_15865 [Arthrobacter cryoconiti]|nr:hypothetical protein [Arthrobacter cryoconiti]